MKDMNTDENFCITQVRLFSSSAQVCFQNTDVGLWKSILILLNYKINCSLKNLFKSAV